MSLPGNGIFVVRGEMSTLMTAMRRGTRWNSSAYVDDEKDTLMKLFVDLKQLLNRVEDLRLIEPSVFLAPFLEVIRTDETTGAVTSLALTAINKFLSYGLIDPTCPNLAVTVENIVDAVTHARFMGTDQSSDGVTLFRVVEVLHTLMRSPEGSALTNEAVCEVMLSCFKICFEPRLNELLRRSAEQALKDMVLLLFMRLPQFSEDRSEAGLLKKFQMMAVAMEHDKKQRKKSSKVESVQQTTLQRSNSQRGDISKGTVAAAERKMSAGQLLPQEDPQTPQTLAVTQLKAVPLGTTPITPAGNILDMQGKITQTPTTTLASAAEGNETNEIAGTASQERSEISQGEQAPSISVQLASPQPEEKCIEADTPCVEDAGSSEYVNSVGVRFTQQNSVDGSEGFAPLLPYGLPCIQELFRFLILLCNPLDKQNTDTMMHMGLSLLTVAFEVGADSIGKYDTLLELVKDDLCRNLIALMGSERLTIFAANLQLCFLLFESLRGHLKFQLEAYLKKLSEIIASDNPRTQYEMRELALDNLLQLWRVPGFVAELYINYDCDLYCSDIFENLTNLLSKYTLSATNAVYSTHIISMDTLLSVIDNIERNCIAAKSVVDSGAVVLPALASRHSHSRNSSSLEGVVVDGGSGSGAADCVEAVDDNKSVVENISKFINSSSRMRLPSGGAAEACVTQEYLSNVKQKKQVLTQGTELFNQRPDKGIQYLQENGIIKPHMDPMEVALFLRENPGLDKKMIGEYISKKKNVDSKILMNFVDSFDFTGLRVDQALRMYLETFRLPGEAPLIFLVLEHFADHWHKQNGEPFANTDAAFSLAYAIIMLNMDQHNSNAKRLNVPMTQEDFLKNLRGLNGGIDFDQDMLSTVFNAIKNEEIVMPAEQTGSVRENYLWKVLLRRGVGVDGLFHYVQDAAYDMEIFNIVWGASLSALSFMFDKSNENGYHRTLTGFTKCAVISAHYNLHADFDALILTLCKFTTLLSTTQQEPPNAVQNEILQAINFGLNPKAQAAIKTVFSLVHNYGECLREGWRNILDLFLQLFRLKLLPKSLVEVEDFCEPNGKAQLVLEKPCQKQEAGLFSTWYSLIASDGQREPSHEEQEIIKMGRKCIKECQLDQIIQESKFVQLESLQELLKNVLALIKAPNAHKSVGLPYAEDIAVFWMELLVKIVIQNRDRMIPLWPNVRDQMYLLLMGGASCGYDYLRNRSIVAVLKLAIYLMRNEELCPIVLQSLKMLLMLKPATIVLISKQISIGIYELLKTSAQNIHSEQDWQIIFMILECVGAGAVPPEFDDTCLPLPNGGTPPDGALSSEEDSGLPDRGYTSDSDVAVNKQHQQQHSHSNTSSPFPSSPTGENWILVSKDTDLTIMSRPQSPPGGTSLPPSLYSLVYKCQLIEHSPFALFKCWDSLVFIVRNVAHITPYNFESCVRCIRTFVEACRDGGFAERRKYEAALAAKAQNNNNVVQKKKSSARRPQADGPRRPTGSDGHSGSSLRTEEEDEDLAQRYETLSIQLLDLMYTLYTRTAQIFRWWAEEGCAVPQCSALWAQGWSPLLQGIARLAMDRRREVRTYAISCLQQRALLMPDLQTLSGAEWSSCFHQVLFPLLSELLPESGSVAHLDLVLLEESRIRMATIMSKVFLHHLTPLLDLGPSFNELWLEVLDYIEKFMRVGSDMLSEQMQEILKNMLLVMHSVRVFHNADGTLNLPLWELTWQRIAEFLPNLQDELFRNEGNPAETMKRQTATSTTTTMAANSVFENLGNSTQPQVAHQQLRATQQPPAQELLVSPLIGTTAESPRHSIILQPPLAEAVQAPSLILGQLPTSTSANIPILVPQQQQQQPLQPHPPILSPIPLNPLIMNGTPKLVQPIPIMATMAATSAAPNNDVATLPDLVNDASKVVNSLSAASPQHYSHQQQQPQQGQVHQPQQSVEATLATNVASNNYNSYAYAIELPEIEMISNMYGVSQEFQQQQQQHQQQVAHQQQQQYELYYAQHQQFLQQQQQQHHQFAPYVAETTSNLLESEHFSPTYHSTSTTMQTTTTVTTNNAPRTSEVLPPPDQISNSAIVQSFASSLYGNAPQPTQSEVDIYQEYVQNPYNLLHPTPVPAPAPTATTTAGQQANSDSNSEQLPLQPPVNLFASAANYFNASVDPSAIPPGSEVLYGQP